MFVSSAAKHYFMKQTGFPKGKKGYVVDHKIEFALKPYRYSLIVAPCILKTNAPASYTRPETDDVKSPIYSMELGMFFNS
jgi:hypothetical protein